MVKIFSFSKSEKLSNKSLIKRLFDEGRSISFYPFSIIYLPVETGSDIPVQVLISIPKRNIRKAINRNLLKRRIREAYRLNKYILYNKLADKNVTLALGIIYLLNNSLPYNIIELKVKSCLKLISERLDG